jgi:hypothetical protein
VPPGAPRPRAAADIEHGIARVKSGMGYEALAGVRPETEGGAVVMVRSGIISGPHRVLNLFEDHFTEHTRKNPGGTAQGEPAGRPMGARAPIFQRL